MRSHKGRIEKIPLIAGVSDIRVGDMPLSISLYGHKITKVAHEKNGASKEPSSTEKFLLGEGAKKRMNTGNQT